MRTDQPDPVPKDGNEMIDFSFEHRLLRMAIVAFALFLLPIASAHAQQSPATFGWPAPPPSSYAWPPTPLAPGSIPAQSLPPGVDKMPLPANAPDLDALLAGKKYLELRQILLRPNRTDDVLLNMNWEKRKLVGGGSAFINFVYAHDLWRVATTLPVQAGGLKETAVLMLLYAYELITIDGMKCQDVSAPAHRRDQLLTMYPQIWQHIASLPEQRSTVLVKTALGMERSIAPLRADDDFLCRDGLDEMKELLARNGDKPLPQVPTPPGQIGITKAVPTNPDYKPKFLPKEIWAPKQDEARAAMPRQLAQIVERFKGGR
jgi:hypothetical protein